MATKDNWEDVIRTNYTDLLKMIDTDNGLHGEIRRLRIFSPIALKSFWDLKDKTERIDKMLRNLQRKDYESFNLFCEALKASDQGHVVKNHLSRVKDVSSRQVLVTDSVADVDASHNRGISHEMKACFQHHWNDLIAEIAFDEDLLGELEKYKIMTPIQLNKLRDKATEAERTEYMLNILERGSERQFESFRSALRSCNQHFIADDYLRPRSAQQRQAINRSSSLADPLPAGNPTSSAPPRSAPVGREDVPPFQCQQQETQLNVGNHSVNIEELCVKTNEQVRLEGAYRCDSNPRGRAVIINNEFFLRGHLTHREGSRNDVRLLKDLFQFLHFDPKVHENKTDEEIMKILKEESKDEGNSQCDMFVLFIMSHGICGEIFGMNGLTVKTEDILELFDGKNCRSLCNKPKLIFIQACQGEMKTVGVAADEGSMTVTDSGIYVSVLKKTNSADDFDLSLPLRPLPVYQNDAVPSETVHEKADIALIYATVRDHVAWRRRDTGSLFVKYIDEVFRSRASKEDLMSMLTQVFERLHSHRDDNHHYKQIGEKRDTLRRKVYLLP